MAAAYTQVTTGARLAYTFSGDVEPNAQGLLDRSKERSEGHDVLSQCSNLPRSQVIHNTLVLLVLLVRAVPSTQPVENRTGLPPCVDPAFDSDPQEIAGGQAKKHPLNGLVRRKIYRKPQVFQVFP